MIKLNIPHHVALIPDGNRRWAKKKNLPSFYGHKKGFDALINIAKKSREIGIKVLTVWAFSTENWKRTKEEVAYLMDLYITMLDKYIKEAKKDEIRIVHLGRKDRINKKLLKKINEAEKQTAGFNKYFLCIALDYGGRDEIIRVISKFKNNKTNSVESEFNKYFQTNILPFPDPDLIIRTGGEKRLSGFMLWQSEYSELMFVKKYLPDFSPTDFEKCIKKFSFRQRRFGR